MAWSSRISSTAVIKQIFRISHMKVVMQSSNNFWSSQNYCFGFKQLVIQNVEIGTKQSLLELLHLWGRQLQQESFRTPQGLSGSLFPGDCAEPQMKSHEQRTCSNGNSEKLSAYSTWEEMLAGLRRKMSASYKT